SREESHPRRCAQRPVHQQGCLTCCRGGRSAWCASRRAHARRSSPSMLLPRLPGSSLWSSSGQKRITTIVANDAPVRFGKGLTTQQLFCWNASKTMAVVDLQRPVSRGGGKRD